ncbi:MAG: hypothetical protein ACLUNH_09360 [Hominenteromicrobium sp.]|uniref:hypothetical protein n=1 Tax=Hominenteromicrobium sp. TaxID=3073581 RepID=UPI003995BC97
MARHQAAEREKSVSVLASLLPFLSVLYSEFIFAYFAHMSITPVKVWMALGLGGIALALSRTTPLKGLNFLLLTVWTVGLWGFTFVQFLYRQMFGVCMGLKAGIKGLEFLAGLVQIIGQNWLFSLLMIVVPVLHFTLTRSLLKRRVSVLGKLTGANWMAPLGAWLLSVILIFAGVVLGLRGTAGEPSDRQLLMTRFDAEASLQSFGAAPEFLLDVKYNVLRIAGAETVEYYLVQDGKDPVQVTPTPESATPTPAPENS